MNYFTDNTDLQFHFDHSINFKTLFELLSSEERDAVGCATWQEYKSFWHEAAQSLGQACAENLPKHAKTIDSKGLKFENGEVKLPEELKQNIQVFQELGAGAFSVEVKYGGMGAPFSLEMMSCEMMNRGCPSTMLNLSWYGPIAKIILKYGSEELIAKYTPSLIESQTSGNMALTEADAGSDLSALRTYAQKQEDGSYTLHGSKRFITNGNSEISLVLAKTSKGAEGLQHLSLFLSPQKIDNGETNYIISNLEEKLGLKGSATCELIFDGSKAFLLGNENEGYKMMLKLMNESRIGVGFQGIGLMEATYQQAVAYANERHSWGQPIAHHELIQEKLLDLEVTLRATRSLGVRCAWYRSIADFAKRKLTNQEISEQESID